MKTIFLDSSHLILSQTLLFLQKGELRSSLSVTKAITFATLATKHEIAIMNKLIENNLV